MLDKVDLLQALDFGSDLKKITTFQPSFKCIFTTTDTRNDKDKPVEEFEEFKEIKKTFMGSDKALIIKLNHDVNQQISMFEKINHLYVSCDSNLDKFILLFSFIKLAIVQGKTVVLCNDVVQAYRIKLFLNRFSLKSFVLAPDMPKN